MSEPRRRGWYTFGNHFHWVGMQWLWGNGILARSIADMLEFIAATGAPANVNFDANGYERLAAEEPEAVDALRRALSDGRAEVVGASFGQPYALFHHGESAVRQLSFGLRTAVRVLGVRPRAFWEEEFYFFPQLPQLLVDAGYTGASLFFQWTWHTPEVPVESAPVIAWEGLDGSVIPTLPRSELNLHQWPEDVRALIESGKVDAAPVPVVQQWLELLPSPDWMCRSELVIPGVRDLFDNAGVEFTAATLSGVIDGVGHLAEPRRYAMDDVFHGMSIGKNGNRHHRLSARVEHTLLAAEALSVVAGQLGRPYAHWSKYPHWELEEGWRELLAFQAHDNDECEGLNGHVGYLGAERGRGLGEHVLERTAVHLARALVAPGESVALNPVGWEREAVVKGRRVRVPAFSVVPLSPDAPAVAPAPWVVEGDLLIAARGDLRVEVRRSDGAITRIGDVAFPHGMGVPRWVRGGTPETFELRELRVEGDTLCVRRGVDGAELDVHLTLAPVSEALDIVVRGDLGEGPDGRAATSLMWDIVPDGVLAQLRHDTPYAVTAISGRNRWRRKYPTGAWMTSPQEFETVVDTFTALQLLDLALADGRSLLWLHDGAQGFAHIAGGVSTVLSMRDPWDEDQFDPRVELAFRVRPHGGMSAAEVWRAAQEFTRPVLTATASTAIRDLPARREADRLDIVAFDTHTGGSILTSLYRDSDFAATGFAAHVNHAAQQPVLARVVEFDGKPDRVRLRFTVPVRGAWRCRATGDVVEELDVRDGAIEFEVRGHEVATVAVDLAPAPGDDRTLDADRGVWALVHHTEEEQS